MRLPYRKARNSHGITVAELAAMLPVLLILGLGGAALVASLGLFLDYKMKLTYVAQAGARVYMNTVQWAGAKRPGVAAAEVAQDAVKDCARQMGLGPVTATVSVLPNSLADNVTYVKVEVKGASPLLPFAKTIGRMANVSESITYAYGNQNPIGLSYVCGGDTPHNVDLDGPGGVLIPIYAGGLTNVYNPIKTANDLIIQVPGILQGEYYQTNGGVRPI